MTDIDERLSSQDDVYAARWFSSADISGPAMCNVLTGLVMSKKKGLTRTTLRIRVSERTDLRVRWAASSLSEDAVDIGQMVRLTIPEEAVQLEAGGFRRSKQRWNRWIGRVLLVDRNNYYSVTSIDVYRDIMTLKSRGPVIGAHRPLAAWDTVNIVVDPQRVSLTPINRSSPRIANSSSYSLGGSQLTSVWLRAIIRSFRLGPIGQHVVLDVGAVKLSALVKGDREAMRGWTVGSQAEINISLCDAWIRLDGEGLLFRCCVVLSSQTEDLQLSDPPSMNGEL